MLLQFSRKRETISALSTEVTPSKYPLKISVALESSLGGRAKCFPIRKSETVAPPMHAPTSYTVRQL